MGPMVWTSTLNTVRIAGFALVYRMQDAWPTGKALPY
jgi:hypothetical protein